MNDLRAKLRTVPQGIKASAALFFANVVTKGIAYLTTPLYTRLLTDTEYGQASVFITWERLFGIVAMFCLSYGVFNNGMLDYPKRRSEYSFSMLILSNLITVVFFVVLLCLYPLIGSWIGLDGPLLALMGLIFLFQPAYEFWAGRQRYELKYKVITCWTIVLAIASPLAGILCILAAPNDRLYARLFGANGALILIYIGFYIYITVTAKGKLDTGYWKAAFLFNLPLIPHYLSGNLLASADRLMISALVSDAATAYYSVAYSAAAVVSIMWTAVNASLIPYSYEKYKKSDYASVSLVSSLLLTLFAVGCVGMILIAPELISFMATPDYQQAIYAIPPIVGGVFFQTHYHIYANILYYYRRTNYVMYASVFSALLNVVLNYIFIPRFGFSAAGYTTLFCYFIQAVLDYRAQMTVIKKRIYDMKYIGMLSGGMVLFAIAGNLLYRAPAARYAILAAFCLLCVIFRKKLMAALAHIMRLKS